MTQFTSGFDPATLQGQPGGDMNTNIDGYGGGGAGDYSNYAAAADTDPNYQTNPFTAIGGPQDGNFQAPSY